MWAQSSTSPCGNLSSIYDGAFLRKLLNIFTEKTHVCWLGSKYVSDTFLKFFAIIYGLLYIILDFYMTPRSYLTYQMCWFDVIILYLFFIF